MEGPCDWLRSAHGGFAVPYRVRIRRRGSGEIQAGPIFQPTPQVGDRITVPYRGERIAAVVTHVATEPQNVRGAQIVDRVAAREI